MGIRREHRGVIRGSYTSVFIGPPNIGDRWDWVARSDEPGSGFCLGLVGIPIIEAFGAPKAQERK